LRFIFIIPMFYGLFKPEEERRRVRSNVSI